MTTSARCGSLTASHNQIRLLATTHDLTLALTDLDHATPLAAQAFHRMQDARPALPGAQAYDSPSVSGGSSTSSHPERITEQDDPTDADRVLLDRTLAHLWFLVRPDALTTEQPKVLAQITADCLTLRRLIDAWTPHRPTDKQRASVAAVNDGDWCAHHLTAGYTEPTHRNWNVDGIKVPLCQACVDQHRRTGKLPSGEWMQRRASRGKADKERVS